MKSYPKPMFEFNERRQICIDKIKRAYDLKMYGDDRRVLSGQWKGVFGFEDKEGRGKGKRMDEANGDVGVDGSVRAGGKGKRGRTKEEDSDDVGEVDHGDDADEDEEEEEEEPPKKAAKKTASKRKGQGTLDNMVTRNRRGK